MEEEPCGVWLEATWSGRPGPYSQAVLPLRKEPGTVATLGLLG